MRREVADASETVFLMLPDTPDVQRVLFGEDRFAAGLKPGTLVVDISIVSSLATEEFAAPPKTAGGDHLDAPVSGGEVDAMAASLPIMAGAATRPSRAQPLLQAMGKYTTHVGGGGDGQTTQVAN